jgi:hypothetical protein
MIDTSTARDIRQRHQRYQRWRHRHYPGMSHPSDETPPYAPSNAELSQLEVYEFVTNPPGHYFLYVKTESGRATTWMGDELGTVEFRARWRSNFGDIRQNIRIQAINGRTYTGTYYRSAGDYARVRATKGS